jgi:hypothetical protein
MDTTNERPKDSPLHPNIPMCAQDPVLMTDPHAKSLARAMELSKESSRTLGEIYQNFMRD